MSTSGLSPPGSSSYRSGTLTVGDGTWDSTRNDFLLPNLQGLNFATTRYNGMGNRFRDEPEYHTLIIGHGVLAAITFLGIVPAAIFLAKYGREWPGARLSFKLHVYCQTLVVFLATVVLILGWFAVGPLRSLTNPHHGIGVAIYALVLIQYIYGTLMYRRERRRSAFPTKLPLTVWLHKLLGRSIGLLAIVQIALGLTLYGSPKVLFILYAVACFVLVFAYLALDYHDKPRMGHGAGGTSSEYHSDYGSYTSGAHTDGPPPRREGHHWGRDLLAAGGIIGAYEIFKNRRNKKREDGADSPDQSSRRRFRRHDDNGPLDSSVGPNESSRRHSQSRISRQTWEDEKYSDNRRNTWRDRILGATGAFVAFEGAKRFFNRRRRRDDDSYDESTHESRKYRPPPGGDHSMVSNTDVSRVEAGEAPLSPDTPRINLGGAEPLTPSMTPSRPPRHPRFNTTDMSYSDSRASPPPPRRRRRDDFDDDDDDDGPHTLRDSIAVFGAIAGVREWNKRRRKRRESQRADDLRRQELDNEDVFQRRHRNTYPRPQDSSAANHAAESSTLMTGPGTGPIDPSETLHPPLPATAGAMPIGDGGHPAGSRLEDVFIGPGYPLPPPPPGPPPGSSGRLAEERQRPPFGSASMPEGAVQPDPNRLLSDPSFTEANTAANQGSAFGRDHGPRVGEDEAGAETAGLVASEFAMSGARRTESDLNTPPRRGSLAPQSSASQINSSGDPRVSLKLHPHRDGQHVTLRRLSEEEAAAERAARRQERRASRIQQQQGPPPSSSQRRFRRGSSFSSGDEHGPPPASSQRYRRSGTSGNGRPPSSSRTPMRPSSSQPITNIPPPPAPSSLSGFNRPPLSDFTPPVAQQQPQQQQQPEAYQPYPQPPSQQNSRHPSTQTLTPQQPPPMPQQQSLPGAPIPPVDTSAIGSPGAYATDTATGTDVSAVFAENRRRRRAERQRRLEAARGTDGGSGVGGNFGGGRVEFQ